MGLFGKKKSEANGCCCAGAAAGMENGKGAAGKMDAAPAAAGSEAAAGIKVLGSGCAKCNELEEAVRAALGELGMDEEIDHVTDFTQIAAYGVMTTPALVVDGKVLSYGKVLKKEEAKKLIEQARG